MCCTLSLASPDRFSPDIPDSALSDGPAQVAFRWCSWHFLYPMATFSLLSYGCIWRLFDAKHDSRVCSFAYFCTSARAVARSILTHFLVVRVHLVRPPVP